MYLGDHIRKIFLSVKNNRLTTGLVRVVSTAMAALSSEVAERATRLAHASNSFFPVVGVVPLGVLNFLALIPGFEARHCIIL